MNKYTLNVLIVIYFAICGCSRGGYTYEFIKNESYMDVRVESKQSFDDDNWVSVERSKIYFAKRIPIIEYIDKIEFEIYESDRADKARIHGKIINGPLITIECIGKMDNEFIENGFCKPNKPSTSGGVTWSMHNVMVYKTFYK